MYIVKTSNAFAFSAVDFSYICMVIRINALVMSDGNFNRSLLPKSELSTGIKAGKAQMRAKAEKAFDYVAEHVLGDVPKSKMDEAKTLFMQMLHE